MVKRRIAAALLLCAAAAAAFYALYAKTASYSYAADTSAFANAVMGYAPGIGYEDEELATLRYLGLTWRELEPEEGVFDWEGIEQKYGLEALRAQGVHLVLRFVCDIPDDDSHLDIPDWLYDKTADGTWYDTDYGRGYSPDYSNPAFRAAHAKAMAALGEHFGTDGFVSFVELGSLGHWGEWHIKSEDGLVPMPGESVRDEYAAAYVSAFPSAKLLMRRPFNFAANNGLGVYNDVTGLPDGTLRWLDWLENGGSYADEPDALAAMPDFWLDAPVGGELTSSISMEEMLADELPRTLELIDASHMSFIGPNAPPAEYAEAYDEILKHIGYRLRVSDAKFKQNFHGAKLSLTWTNDGAAPFYWDWPVYVTLTDESGVLIQTQRVPVDLTEIKPGEEVTAEVSFPQAALKWPGGDGEDETFHVSVGIVDPMTGQYAVRLAMDAERGADGSARLF